MLGTIPYACSWTTWPQLSFKVLMYKSYQNLPKYYFHVSCYCYIIKYHSLLSFHVGLILVGANASSISRYISLRHVMEDISILPNVITITLFYVMHCQILLIVLAMSLLYFLINLQLSIHMNNCFNITDNAKPWYILVSYRMYFVPCICPLASQYHLIIFSESIHQAYFASMLALISCDCFQLYDIICLKLVLISPIHTEMIEFSADLLSDY